MFRLSAILMVLVLLLLAQFEAVAAPPSKVVVVLGDSLAAGLGVDPDEAFPALLQKRVDEAGWKDIVVNAGLSGDTTAGGLRRIDWLLKRQIDVLVLELGGNDGLRGISVESTKENLQGIIDHAKKKYPAIQIILTGLQMPPNMGEKYDAEFQAVFPAVAKTNGVVLVPFLLAGVGGKPELNQADGIHPTPAGHKILADNVWQYLKPVLEKVNAATP